MKQIPLTRGYFAIVDDEDFERVSKLKWSVHIAREARVKYARHTGPRDVNRKQATVIMHRFILGITDSAINIDHRNHDGLDNRRANLRIATDQENTRNSRRAVTNTSGVKGVSWSNECRAWKAEIRISGKGKYLGLFKSKEEAAKVYEAAIEEHFGEFAFTG